jgi:hypothetical protein
MGRTANRFDRVGRTEQVEWDVWCFTGNLKALLRIRFYDTQENPSRSKLACTGAYNLMI